MSIASEFKEFIMRGNVIDLAVGMVVGTAFSGIVKSLVDDVIMPPIGLLIGGVDFSNLFITLKDGAQAAPEAGYASLAAAQAAGAVTLNIGLFINTVISFLIIAAAIFCVEMRNVAAEAADERTGFVRVFEAEFRMLQGGLNLLQGVAAAA